MLQEASDISFNYLNFLLLFQNLVKNDNVAMEHQIDCANDFMLKNNSIKQFPHVDKIGELITQYNQNAKKIIGILNKHKSILMRINYLINIRCKHNWVNDHIDIDPDKSKSIQYCSVCNMTKR